MTQPRYVTLIAVVPVPEGYSYEADLEQGLAGAIEMAAGTPFAVVVEGVSPEAVAAGADPSSW